MSYHIYTTEGIILKKTPFGEANILCTILTADLGLILASAQSARLSVSKLKGGLQEYTRMTLSCIKGKNGWKITNAVFHDNIFFSSAEYTHTCIARVASVLIRMMPGEESNPELFDTVSSVMECLSQIDEKSVSNFEVLIMLRILYHLGYVSKNEKTEKFLTTEWDEKIFADVADSKIELVSLVNNGLKESHL